MRQSFYVPIPLFPTRSKHVVDQRPRGRELALRQVALGESKGRGNSDVVEAGALEPGDCFRQLGDAGIEPAGPDLAVSMEHFGKGDVERERVKRKGFLATTQPAFDVALKNMDRPEAIQAHDFEAPIVERGGVRQQSAAIGEASLPLT